MRSWSLQLVAFLLVVASLAFGQVGNGTITGTVTDPAGAAVAGAAVEAKNAETGVVFRAVSTTTGNYTIGDLPVGNYTVTVAVTGFKTYSHSNLAINATQVLREDVALQVGAASQSVTVTAEASLLKTETGELAHNVSIDQLDELPLLGIGTINAGTSGYRNPYNTMLTLPGISAYQSSGTVTVNGLASGFGSSLTETMRVEGQDATSRLFGTYDYTQMTQPSADSIQEVAYQTSNYSAEYGEAGTVVINMTMKSGTNQYHGSGYDYFVNEDLNAGDPYSISGGPGSPTGGDDGKYRPRNRRNDFGGTLGGPIVIPKIYNGHNKTFFFFNYEQFLETTQYSFVDTVPATAYTQGNFSAISPNGNCSLCSSLGIPTGALAEGETDAMGRPLYANEIYDPLSRGVVASTNLGYANPFPNNSIPVSRFDPISVKIASLFPAPQNANLTGNYSTPIAGGRYSAIPSVKIDHNIDSKDKLSFYYSENNTQSQISSPLGDADGLPTDIGGYRGSFITTYTERLNYDRTLSPTLLLHLGIGYLHTSFSDRAPNLTFNPSSVGLSGFLLDRNFPIISGMCPAPAFGAVGCAGVTGGMQETGPASGQTQNYQETPSMIGNLTWVRGKHTYKAGAELNLIQIYDGTYPLVTMAATTATSQGATAEPFTPLNSLGGFTQGFGYANFLLGDYTATTQTAATDPRYGSQDWAVFVQDSWKVTRKLTVDYGIRWDLNTTQHEQYNRLGQLDATGANANAGGHPGNYQYANTCGCQFYEPSYPFALGPRLGIAYQIDPKTVFRAGWGVTYNFVAGNAGALVATNGVYPLAGINPYVNDQTPGFIAQPVWPVTNPNIYPNVGTVGNAPTVPDQQQNRPPRINQFSIGFQREITRSFVMEASYVGNRAAWLAGPLGELSQISAAEYASYGLYPYPGTGPCATGGGVCASTSYNNNNDRGLLTQAISSTAVIQKLAGRSILPYAGFPTSSSLLAALYPFPQFGAIEPAGSPTGDSKYDSLQVKATKRLSHNLQAGGAYTWGQGFTRPGVLQDFFNPSGDRWELQQIPPQTLTFNATYTVPKASYLPKYANAVTRGWQIGFFATYQSGMFLTPPTSDVNAEFLTSEDIQVPGQPLYSVGNINDIHSYNTGTQAVLNPNAWEPCPVNATCMAAGNYIKSFRAPRTPVENANIGRNFRIRERMNLQIRGEFVNIFNRTLLPAPITTNPQNALSKNAQGVYTSGYGVIDTYLTPNTAYAAPTNATAPYLQGRTGTLIARFSF